MQGLRHDDAILVMGYPRKGGRFGVGRVLYGAKFNHEFSPPAEDRPIWDFGRKAAYLGFLRSTCNFSLPELCPEKFTYLDSPSSFL